MPESRSLVGDASAKAVLPLGFSHNQLVEITDRKQAREATNSYTKLDARDFQVRMPPDYESTGAKGNSERAFYELQSFDVFFNKVKVSHVGRFLQFPTLPHHEAKNFQGCETLPKFFTMVFQVPLYEPPNPVWGSPKENGDGVHIVLVWSCTEYAQEQVRTGATNAAKLLQAFFQPGQSTHLTQLRAQLKAIPRIVNPDELDINSFTKGVINSYNAKPFMTGPRCHTWYRTDTYCEVVCDAHKFCYMARKAAYHLWETCGEVVIDMGVVVQGNGDAQQPEQMLGAARTFRVDTTAIKPLAYYLNHAEKQAQQKQQELTEAQQMAAMEAAEEGDEN